MKREFLAHRLSYFVLICGLVIFSVSFMAVWPSKNLQRAITLLISVFYFLWGIFSHVKRNKIDKKIVLEYFMVSLIAGLLLFLITI